MPTASDFYEQIERCTGIQLMQDVQMENKICTSCALLLRAALKLQTLCQRAESHLQRQSEKQLSEAEEEQQELYLSDCDSFIGNDNASDTQSETYEVAVETTSLTGSTEDIVIRKTKAPTAIVASETSKRKAGAAAAKVSKKKPSLSYLCNICNNVYTEKVKLTAHLRQHSGYKPHECEICHKRFRQTPQLARHMNSHTGLRPYKCDFCDSCFADPSTRIKHQRIHTNERPYKCSYCNKSFAYSNVLNVHMKIHTGEKPFKCSYCGKTFTQLHHKNTHERSHNPNKDLDISEITSKEE
ncbi:CG4854 [Drosophila busckii]|uniref:CG4854 n=2 Tax=Drosophila busckii TaxID=30019 RepID=A0A0M4EQL3_DROBS|nr:CG4854 [Drosophila busckii]